MKTIGEMLEAVGLKPRVLTTRELWRFHSKWLNAFGEDYKTQHGHYPPERRFREALESLSGVLRGARAEVAYARAWPTEGVIVFGNDPGLGAVYIDRKPETSLIREHVTESLVSGQDVFVAGADCDWTMVLTYEDGFEEPIFANGRMAR